MKTAIFLAKGFEDVEAVTPIDFLRRAEIPVDVVGVDGLEVSSAHGLTVKADIALKDFAEDYDAVIFPGGLPGAENLAACPEIIDIARSYYKNGKMVAAICASPALVLNKAGVLSGKKATCYPGFEDKFDSDVKFLAEAVVCDGNLITSRGPGTSAKFACSIIAALKDKETADAISEGTLQGA